MKKHIESNHYGLLKQILKQTTNLAPRSPLDHEPDKKRPTCISFYNL
jgi:hypothetical protein